MTIGDDTRDFGRARCLELMASVPIGRIVYTDQALPAITPVNFVLDGDEVTIRTGSGSTLAAALREAVVAFQADDFDPEAASGWSVTVTGQARLVDDPDECERLAGLPLRPWAPAALDGRYVRIPATRVSGMLLGRPAAAGGAGRTVA